MKKKILFIIWSFSHGGGAEKILSNIVNNLDENKYDIDILEYFYVGIKKEKISENVNLLPPILDLTNKNIINKIKIKLISILISRCPKLIRKICLNRTYDIEISFNYMIPTFLLNDKSYKRISWIHGDIYDLKTKDREFKIQKKFLKNVDNIVAISNKTYNSIVELFPEYSNKASIIHNGYEFDKIKKLASFSNETKDYVDIIFCGRLDKNKNPLKMLEILKKTNEKGYNFSLGYLGSGELLSELKRKIEEYNLESNVKLFGYQNNPYKYIANTKIICMTSYSEGFPTVIIEGMTLGKPFISTNVAGVDEMSYNNNCGFVTDDINQYSDNIIRLLTDSNLYKKMSCNCIKNVEYFSVENQIKKLEELINKE